MHRLNKPLVIFPLTNQEALPSIGLCQDCVAKPCNVIINKVELVLKNKPNPLMEQGSCGEDVHLLLILQQKSSQIVFLSLPSNTSLEPLFHHKTTQLCKLFHIYHFQQLHLMINP